MCTYVTTNASAVCLLHYIAITNHLRPIPHLPYNYSQPILPPYAMQTKNRSKDKKNTNIFLSTDPKHPPSYTPLSLTVPASDTTYLNTKDRRVCTWIVQVSKTS